MINKETITKYSQLGLLISICLILFFWRHIQLLIPGITIEQILGSFVTILSSMFLYFDSRLSAAIRGPVNPIKHMNLNECFNQISQFKNIKHMRIYAISTDRIKSLFSSSNIHVDKCDILLRGFTKPELENEKNVRHQERIRDIISRWEREKNDGNIKELSINKYFFPPTEYYAIIDEKVMIAGLYILTPEGWGDVIDPIYIQSSSDEAIRLIKRYIERFDKLKALLGNNSK